MTEKFASPSDLRAFALETAAQLRAAGLAEAADKLEAAATYVTGSGWEWLGELGLATRHVKRHYKLPQEIAANVKRIHKTATSRRPYG